VQQQLDLAWGMYRPKPLDLKGHPIVDPSTVVSLQDPKGPDIVRCIVNVRRTPYDGTTDYSQTYVSIGDASSAFVSIDFMDLPPDPP
jgi:hypothetical protein